MMEVYPLDPLLRKIDVIDEYESLIWTERYKEYGDFELLISSTIASRNLLKNGTLLAMSKSNYVMVVETVENSFDPDGKRMLSVKGRDLSTLLYDRVARNDILPTNSAPDTEGNVTAKTWELTGTPAAVMRKIFHDICVTGILSVYDKIPFINEGSTFLPAVTIAESIDPVTVALEPMTVYDALVQIADTWNLGFRIIRQFETSKLWFDVYTGNDRTSGQAVRPAVIFSSDLDNLQNTKELLVTEGAKNVAYVYSPEGFLMVTAPGVDPEISGLERRVLVVNATDVTSANTTDIPAALLKIGNEELMKYRTFQAFDGEINQRGNYQYGRDYYLGDIVEERDDVGNTNMMKVTEQIFVSDQEGERSYPTLTLNAFINTGSWLSWLNNKQWVEMGPTAYWTDQP